MASELPVFRSEELHVLDLPGYQCLGSLPDMMAESPKSRWGNSDWWPVLSLSVFRRNPANPDQIQTLSGIRANTNTHEGVVSTLTSAMPPEIERALFFDKFPYLRGIFPSVSIGANGPDPRETAVVASYNPNVQFVPDNMDLLPYLCHDIFARKLGQADLINTRWGERHLGTVSLMKVVIGFSNVGEDTDGEPLWEPLKNWGASFMLDDEFAESLPDSTKRYSQLGWTNVENFSLNVDQKSVQGLAPYLENGQEIEFCARGLCLATTAELTESDDLLAHLGISK